MEISEILHELEKNRGYFPEAAVREAIEKRDEMIPHLLRILDDVVASPRDCFVRGSSFAHIYALHLLAQFRVTAAYPLVIRYARIEPETLSGISGEVITEGFCRILASVYDGDIVPIKALIEDPAVDEYARAASLRALTTLFYAGQIERAILIEYYGHLLRGGLPRDNPFIFGCLVSAIADIHPGELLDEIRLAYEAQRVDSFHVSLEEVEDDAARDRDAVLAEHRESDGELIDDTIACMNWWACFSPTPGRRRVRERAAIVAEPEPRPEPAEAATSYVRETPKVGRNEPCPCGSGKKYKKCCGA